MILLSWDIKVPEPILGTSVIGLSTSWLDSLGNKLVLILGGRELYQQLLQRCFVLWVWIFSQGNLLQMQSGSLEMCPEVRRLSLCPVGFQIHSFIKFCFQPNFSLYHNVKLKKIKSCWPTLTFYNCETFCTDLNNFYFNMNMEQAKPVICKTWLNLHAHNTHANMNFRKQKRM